MAPAIFASSGWTGHPHGRLVSLKTKDQAKAKELFKAIKRKRLEEKLVSISGETRFTIS